MRRMLFAASVQRGERIGFVFHNKGQIAHDAFTGDTSAQRTTRRRCCKEGSMAGGHGMDETAITVDSGKTGSLTYSFDKPGTLEIGRHQVGHDAAGMKVAVTATSSRGSPA